MTTPLMRLALFASTLASLAACGDGDDLPEVEIGTQMDAGRFDAGPLDAHVPDANIRDARIANDR